MAKSYPHEVFQEAIKWLIYEGKIFVNFNQRAVLLLAEINDEMNKKLSTDF